MDGRRLTGYIQRMSIKVLQLVVVVQVRGAGRVRTLRVCASEFDEGLCMRDVDVGVSIKWS